MPRLKGFRFPREVIAYAVWAYHRFALSTADVEDLLAKRGVTVSRETIRQWVNRFGGHFASCCCRSSNRTQLKNSMSKSRMRQAIITASLMPHHMLRFSTDASKKRSKLTSPMKQNSSVATTSSAQR